MGEVAHGCLWWHYFITGQGLVWDNPFEPLPDSFMFEGYACKMCGKQAP